MAKKIEVKLIVNIQDYENLTARIAVDYDKKQIKTIREVCFIKYLKDMMDQHAQPILYAASALAELNEKTIEHEGCCDEF